MEFIECEDSSWKNFVFKSWISENTWIIIRDGRYTGIVANGQYLHPYRFDGMG